MNPFCFPIWLKESSDVLVTRRKEPPFLHVSKTWALKTWLKDLNPLFEHIAKNWTLVKMTQRIEPSFLHDSKTWAFFFKKYDLQELNLLKNMTRRIGPFLAWLKDLNLFFLIMTQRIHFFIRVKELFFLMTFFKHKLDSKRTHWVILKKGSIKFKSLSLFF